MPDDATEGVLSPAARRLINILRPHTPFADAILRRQAERAGLPLASLSERDLETLAPLVVMASALFIDPTALATLKRSLGVK